MLVRNGGFFYRCPAFEKAYFQILFFSQKKGKKGNPRIEFSPANKKEKGTCSPKIVSCISCVLCWNKVFSSCSP